MDTNRRTQPLVDLNHSEVDRIRLAAWNSTRLERFQTRELVYVLERERDGRRADNLCAEIIRRNNASV